CFLFILSLSSLTLASSPFVSSQTSDVKVLSHTYYLDNLGNIVVVGEVQNTGNSIYDNVTLTGTVTGSDGSQVSSGCYISATKLLPGQKSPFYMEFFPENTVGGSWLGVTVTDIQLSVYSAPTTTQHQYQDVVVVNNKPTLIDGVYWVNCTLQNNGTQTATKIMVFGTFYNSSGAVVAIGDIINSVASLSAGATAKVNVPAFDLNQTLMSDAQKISGYSLLVQVQAPLLTGAVPTINPSSTPIIGDNPPITSGGGDLTIIYVAIIIVVAVVLVAMVVLRYRKPKVEAVNQPAKTAKPRHATRRERKSTSQ
ncbi:MAG TPA: hypothetical protein VMD05_10490, partial [Candidatus Nanoarchaeia archaeon]|nr:hypothetical protein [Candidatus Nanoarchaeia archaeon]